MPEYQHKATDFTYCFLCPLWHLGMSWNIPQHAGVGIIIETFFFFFFNIMKWQLLS